MKRSTIALAIGTALVLSAIGTLETRAATITASELIQDVSTSGGRDLQRVRFDGTATTTLSAPDSTIVSDNSVSTSFGLSTKDDVTYVHRLDWLTHGTLTGALLEITAKGAQGNNDTVIVLDAPSLTLGTLAIGNSTTALLNSWNINVDYLTDDLLQIKIDKNLLARGDDAEDDKVEIVSSKLTFTWNTVSASSRVPDGGASVALLGIGVIGLLAFKRKVA